MSRLIVLLWLMLDAATFGPAGRFHLEHSKDDFGMRSHGIVETLPSHRTKFYPLPQSNAAKYIRLRPQDLRINPLSPDHYERSEVIGPFQVEGDKIWFGNNFYDGEGMRGVGAFGYFDTATLKYTLFSPPEVAPYEISAILVEPDYIWLGLDQFGEDISTSPGGLVQWDRVTQAVHRYPLEFGIASIRADGQSLRLTTRGGYAIFHGGEVQRFRANGKPIAKLPPPPTHY